jgi:hypothetical protein
MSVAGLERLDRGRPPAKFGENTRMVTTVFTVNAKTSVCVAPCNSVVDVQVDSPAKGICYIVLELFAMWARDLRLVFTRSCPVLHVNVDVLHLYFQQGEHAVG